MAPTRHSSSDHHQHHQPFSIPYSAGTGTIQPSILQTQPHPPPLHPSPPLPSHSPSHQQNLPSSHLSSSSLSSSDQWPTSYEEMDATASAGASTSSSRPPFVSADSFPPFPPSSSSTSTVKPRQGKERSGSLMGPASSKGKAKATTGPSRAAKKKKSGDDGGGSGKVLQRKDGTLRTQYSSCGACRLRRVR